MKYDSDNQRVHRISSVIRKFMYSLTRCACSSTWTSSFPTTLHLTGPPLGSNSLYACAWNCVTASAKSGCVTLLAPWNGWERSVYLNPNRSKPFV